MQPQEPTERASKPGVLLVALFSLFALGSGVAVVIIDQQKLYAFTYGTFFNTAICGLSNSGISYNSNTLNYQNTLTPCYYLFAVGGIGIILSLVTLILSLVSLSLKRIYSVSLSAAIIALINCLWWLAAAIYFTATLQWIYTGKSVDGTFTYKASEWAYWNAIIGLTWGGFFSCIVCVAVGLMVMLPQAKRVGEEQERFEAAAQQGFAQATGQQMNPGYAVPYAYTPGYGAPPPPVATVPV